MNESEDTATRSSQIIRSVAIFVAGVVLGAAAMVEVVPAAQLASPTAEGAGGAGTPLSGPAGGTAPTGGDDASASGEGASAAAAGATGGSAAAGTDASGSTGSGTTDTGSGDTGGSAGGGGTNNASGGGALACEPGKNGGATDQGVTADEIWMATTVVESGIGSAFLGEARFGMDAVANKVNRSGGICGRQLRITYRDDAWEAQTGAQYLRNFLDDEVFAIPVGPSSEGLNAVIESGDFDKEQVPVVGTNGLSLLQYEKKDGSAQPWIFPVAAATVSSARIMAKDAYDRGAENFSIVFTSNYRFGAEAAEAFNAEVKRLTGDDIPGYEKNSTSCNRSYCAVTAGQSNYSTQVQEFEEGDFVALFLEPDTAQKWMTDSNAPSANDPDIPYGFGGAQPLFTTSFGETCKAQCDGMLVWTGFKPYVEQKYRSDPDVKQYVNDLVAVNRNADKQNQFTQGSYIGMKLLVEGLEAVGPNLTRDRLRQALNRMTFDSGLALADPMRFSADNRYVAIRMQAWEIEYSGTFAGWRSRQIVTDPRFGG